MGGLGGRVGRRLGLIGLIFGTLSGGRRCADCLVINVGRSRVTLRLSGLFDRGRGGDRLVVRGGRGLVRGRVRVGVRLLLLGQVRVGLLRRRVVRRPGGRDRRLVCRVLRKVRTGQIRSIGGGHRLIGRQRDLVELALGDGIGGRRCLGRGRVRRVRRLSVLGRELAELRFERRLGRLKCLIPRGVGRRCLGSGRLFGRGQCRIQARLEVGVLGRQVRVDLLGLRLIRAVGRRYRVFLLLVRCRHGRSERGVRRGRVRVIAVVRLVRRRVVRIGRLLDGRVERGRIGPEGGRVLVARRGQSLCLARRVGREVVRQRRFQPRGRVRVGRGLFGRGEGRVLLGLVRGGFRLVIVGNLLFGRGRCRVVRVVGGLNDRVRRALGDRDHHRRRGRIPVGVGYGDCNRIPVREIPIVRESVRHAGTRPARAVREVPGERVAGRVPATGRCREVDRLSRSGHFRIRRHVNGEGGLDHDVYRSGGGAPLSVADSVGERVRTAVVPVGRDVLHLPVVSESDCPVAGRTYGNDGDRIVVSVRDPVKEVERTRLPSRNGQSVVRGDGRVVNDLQRARNERQCVVVARRQRPLSDRVRPARGLGRRGRRQRSGQHCFSGVTVHEPGYAVRQDRKGRPTRDRLVICRDGQNGRGHYRGDGL